MKQEFEAYLKKRSQCVDSFIPTGIKALDELVDGYYGGTVWIVGAWPGIGKTTLVLNLLKGLRGHKVSVFDTEMSKYRYMEKFLSLMTDIPYKEIRTNLKTQLPHLLSRLSFLDSYSLHINDKSNPTMADIESEVKSFSPRVLIVDYFQNIAVNNSQFRYAEFTAIARALEGLTKNYGITTILCSQLRKPGEDSTKPTLFDLKETGKLGEMAHVVLLLSRKDNNMVVEVAKNRDGLIGGMELNGNWSCNKLL